MRITIGRQQPDLATATRRVGSAFNLHCYWRIRMSRKLDEIESNRFDDRHGAACRPELSHRVLDMKIDCIFADVQYYPDIPRRFSPCGPPQTIGFPPG